MSDLLEARRNILIDALCDPWLELNPLEVAEIISELAEIDTELDGTDTGMSAQLDDAGFGSFGPM